MNREQLEKLGEHLDNVQTAITAAKNELKLIEKADLWNRPNTVDGSLENFEQAIEERVNELDGELSELDAEENGPQE